MSDCCAETVSKKTFQNCPRCGVSCKSVEMNTLFHNVKFPENQAIEKSDYYYCPSASCYIGYFSSCGPIIPKRHLRAKQEIEKGWLCYCYDISKAQYRDALSSHTSETIKNFVIEQTKSGSCACGIRNPSGQCCLSNFKKMEKDHGKS